MSKLILVTGGTRSGKSSFAEGLLKGNDDVLYIATSMVYDEEMAERVRKHKASRNQLWETYEGHRMLNAEIKNTPKKTIMLECVGTMITNIIFDKYNDEEIEKLSKGEVAALESNIIGDFRAIIDKVRNSDKDIVFITNEVGFSLVSEYKLGRIFTDILGRVNQLIARESDEVYLVACGLPMRLK